MNCARIYNESLSFMHSHISNNPLAYPNSFHLYNRPEPVSACKLDIDEEHVLNAFFIYTLILDKSEKQTILMMSHKESSHRERLKPLLAERNRELEGTGQEAYSHACDLCFIVYKDNNGREGEQAFGLHFGHVANRVFFSKQ